jgi:hypothetical protein
MLFKLMQLGLFSHKKQAGKITASFYPSLGEIKTLMIED